VASSDDRCVGPRVFGIRRHLRAIVPLPQDPTACLRVPRDDSAFHAAEAAVLAIEPETRIG
jgi:hypothetical protein